jgi:hypothetical protein
MDRDLVIPQRGEIGWEVAEEFELIGSSLVTSINCTEFEEVPSLRMEFPCVPLMAHPRSPPNSTSLSPLTGPRDHCITLQGYHHDQSFLTNFLPTQQLGESRRESLHNHTVCIFSGKNQNQGDFYPFVLLEISVLLDLSRFHLDPKLRSVLGAKDMNKKSSDGREADWPRV